MGATLSYLDKAQCKVSPDCRVSTDCMLAGVSLVLTQMSTLTNSCPQLCFSWSNFNLNDRFYLQSFNFKLFKNHTGSNASIYR